MLFSQVRPTRIMPLEYKNGHRLGHETDSRNTQVQNAEHVEEPTFR